MATQIIPTLEEIGELPFNIWFQQDSKQPHFERNVCNFQKDKFYRSPDLNPIRFFSDII